MEHVEYFKTRLVDGQDDSPVGVSQFVEVREEFHGGGGIQTYVATVTICNHGNHTPNAGSVNNAYREVYTESLDSMQRVHYRRFHHV